MKVFGIDPGSERTGYGCVETDGRRVRGRVQRAGRALPGLLASLHDAGVGLEAIEVHRPTLDDVFLTLTGRSLRDAEAGGEDGGGQDGGATGTTAGTVAGPTTGPVISTDETTGARR